MPTDPRTLAENWVAAHLRFYKIPDDDLLEIIAALDSEFRSVRSEALYLREIEQIRQLLEAQEKHGAD